MATLICFPILTAIFDLIGIFGGYLTGSVLLNVDSGVYWNRVFESVTWADVQGGYIKALVFGLLTISICAYRGYNTHRKASFPGVRGERIGHSGSCLVKRHSIGGRLFNHFFPHVAWIVFKDSWIEKAF